MRSTVFFAAAVAAAAAAAPAFAQGTMKSDTMKPDTMKPDTMHSDAMPMETGGTMTTMKGGEVLAVMPDGHMGTTMMTDHAMAAKMMKSAKPVKHCMMFMTGSNGKTMMVDTSSKSAMRECEKIAK
ncbi:hypothetical protein [Jiella sp. M17.18]|uniref:hypothetical protein n=1 Tax=Jiella sp. M17.18 TaxID=3234247 RepID=UPI0034DF4060